MKLQIRKLQFAVLVGSLFALVACHSDTEHSPPVEDSYTTPPPPSFQDHDEFQRPMEGLHTSPGKWIEKDGSLFCDDYLVRYEDVDYCIAKVPEGWLPFEFDGKTYYAIPLEGEDD